MGMFDSVNVPCPTCLTRQEAQSKSGDCTLAWYEIEDAPIDVLFDVNRHAPFTCEECGTRFQVVLAFSAHTTTSGLDSLWQRDPTQEALT